MPAARSTDVHIAGSREEGLDTRIVGKTSLGVGLVYLGFLIPRALMTNPDDLLLIERLGAYLQLGSFIFPTLVAFFGLYLARGDMRDGIAGAFVVAFFLILIESIILNLGTFESTEGSVRNVALTNFMTLVGTIVVFFFGSEAAIRIGGQYLQAKENSAAAMAAATVTAAEVGRTNQPADD